MGPIDNVIYSEFKEKIFTFFFEKKKKKFEIFSSKSLMTCPKSEMLVGSRGRTLKVFKFAKISKILVFFCSSPLYIKKKGEKSQKNLKNGGKDFFICKVTPQTFLQFLRFFFARNRRKHPTFFF